MTEDYVLQQQKAYGMEIEKRYGTPEKISSQEPVLVLGE